MRLVTALVAGLLLLAVSLDADAGASARLVYVRGPGAEECPGETAVRAAVSVRLGYDPFFAWAHDALFVEVTHTSGAFHVDLKLVDDDNMQRGARSISVKGSDCSGVIDAMALTISLTIDPDSLVRGPTPPPPEPPVPEPPPPPAPAPAPAPQTPLPPAPVGEPSSRVLAHVGAGLGASAGAALAVAADVRLFGGVAWRALSLDVEARGDLPATGSTPSPLALRVQSWLVAGALVPCVHVGPGYACAVGDVGVLNATAAGVSSPHGDSAPWAAAGPRLGLELSLSPSVALRAWGEVLWTLRNSLVTRPGGAPIDSFSAVSGGATVAAVWRFF